MDQDDNQKSIEQLKKIPEFSGNSDDTLIKISDSIKELSLLVISIAFENNQVKK